MKPIALFFLVFTVLAILYSLGVVNCVYNRAQSGIPVDWANIKDCSY